MRAEAQDQSLAECVYASLITDIDALKPGNVGRHAPGHGMSVEDFIRSAELTTPILCDRTLGVGSRILKGVEVTQDGVGCNTNLGILLLFAPLIFAMQHKQAAQSLHASLAKSLNDIGVRESARIFRAICLANPAGLGQSSQYDVHLLPETTIKEAMQVSRDRDRIAFQYVSNYEDVFGRGLDQITTSLNRWNSMEWAATGCYMNLLSALSDSHVQRKFGTEVADNVKRQAQAVMNRFMSCTEPESMRNELLDFDQKLKSRGINPGTTADLTVTSVLVYQLTQHLQIMNFEGH